MTVLQCGVNALFRVWRVREEAPGKVSCGAAGQYMKYRCAMGSTSAGSQVRSSPSARTS